jgi:23S rRNA (cytosine1962-C5)-methyltransferase
LLPLGADGDAAGAASDAAGAALDPPLVPPPEPALGDVQAATAAARTRISASSDRRTTRTSFSLTAVPFDVVGRSVSPDDALVEHYELIDTGDGRRLERFGEHVVDRPFPAADSPRRAAERWEEADLRFDRDGGWEGATDAGPDPWTISLAGLRLELRPTAAGQVGLFPEHAVLVPWLTERIAERINAPSVLNLFAYTGLITLALARAGASVAHVDAAKPSVDWARRNAAMNALVDRPIRWLVDDAPAFVAREVRRGRRYDGVVLDPPTYGHGASGKAWRLERDLRSLLDDLQRLLAPGGFLLLTAHTEALDPFTLGGFLGHDVGVRCIATNLDLLPPLPDDQEAARILAEAHRIFADERLDAPEVT